jgi:hypothetical protein
MQSENNRNRHKVDTLLKNTYTTDLSSKIHIPPISPQKYIYHRSLLENTYTTDLSSKIHIPPISPLTITSGWLN